jgi:hypothetical protein
MGDNVTELGTGNKWARAYETLQYICTNVDHGSAVLIQYRRVLWQDLSSSVMQSVSIPDTHPPTRSRGPVVNKDIAVMAHMALMSLIINRLPLSL